MLKQTVKYTDFDGQECTEDLYFNLTETELREMSVLKKEGLDNYIKRIVKAKDAKEIYDTFKMIVLKAYGVKSPDGKRFIKKENGVRLADEFVETAAYNQLMLDLFDDETGKKAADFIGGMLPKNVNN